MATSSCVVYVAADGTLAAATLNAGEDVANVDVVLFERLPRLLRDHPSLFIIHRAYDLHAWTNAIQIGRALGQHGLCRYVIDDNARDDENPAAALRRRLRVLGVTTFHSLPHDVDEEWVTWVRWEECSNGSLQ